MAYYETKFQTIDGIELLGRVYPAPGQGPGLVMCPGFNAVLTMLNLPECATALQAHGITTLLYNPRNTGSSGGKLRNDIDPTQAVGDISDAVTHLSTLSSVNPKQVGVFGISFGATVSVTAATVDFRVRFTIAVAPLTDFDFISLAHRRRTLQLCMKDRESQVLGNAPHIVPVINQQGESEVGFGRGIETERYRALLRDGRELAPDYDNRVTLMTYYKLALWTPWPLWKLFGLASPNSTAQTALFVVPENDQMSLPKVQRRCYDELGCEGTCKKKILTVTGAGHEDVLRDNYLLEVINSVVDLIRETVASDSQEV
ncbi:Alpha/Beta hydrolase protein [Xylaria flabelliformis]|nr:Alpha/Beta hydrolase protein [Xylaria flabelliformis]